MPPYNGPSNGQVAGKISALLAKVRNLIISASLIIAPNSPIFASLNICVSIVRPGANGLSCLFFGWCSNGAQLGGGKEQNISTQAYNTTENRVAPTSIVAADADALAFKRTAAEVKNIVYGGGAGKGLFFPNGMNSQL